MTEGPSELGAGVGRRAVAGGVVVAAVVVIVAGLAPAFVDARPANEIPVERVDADLADPTADGWEAAPSADVPLASAPSGVPDAGSTSIEVVHVRSARTDDDLFVRLAWPDPSEDRSASDIRTFADAVAVQVPVNESVQPAIAMGSSRNLVNVWYWSPPMGTQELLAGGAGSTTTMTSPEVRSSAARASVEGEPGWVVTFSRPLDPAGDQRTDLTTDEDLSVAVAVWNGAEGERSGRKAVSEWHYFPFGPGPQGPPYETLLWAIAGIAVVAVLVMTVYGIRRAQAGGEAS